MSPSRYTGSPVQEVETPNTEDQEVLLVDPSLFTAPYDASLSRGLRSANVRPIWATRQLRSNESNAFDTADEVLRFFYPLTDGRRRRDGSAAKLVKGLEHLAGLRHLVAMADKRSVATVHFQWSVLPLLDAIAIRRLQRKCPVILTVHDTAPFNGKRVSSAQRSGFHAVLEVADHLIVHTEAGRRTLMAMGIADTRMTVIPHGLLAVGMTPPRDRRSSARWTVVQFGKIQAYKGVDVLVEALAHLPMDVRQQLRVVVAGEPLIPLDPLIARAAALGLSDVLEWRPGYLDDVAVEALLSEADTFVFPYREIEASGVFLLVASTGAWIVASDLGAFSELVGSDGQVGQLVPPGHVEALAAALVGSIGRRPTRSIADAVPSWDAIGMRTAAVYRTAITQWEVAHRKSINA